MSMNDRKMSMNVYECLFERGVAEGVPYAGRTARAEPRSEVGAT
jgi:hypothetical protein